MKLSALLQVAAYSCALIFFVCSCSTEASVQNEFLNTRNIPAQFFKVDGQKDTVLKTSHASLVRIKKGTFEGMVDIEIKEVFTPQEIFQSGLATVSDGRPLRSAGMIYFNATQDGEKVEPSMPVSIGIATKSVDTTMKVFKGEWEKDSTMNWVDPENLNFPDLEQNDTTEINAAALFHAKCSNCHHVFKDMTGPGLRGFNSRGPWKNPLNTLDWLHNPPAFMVKDKYTQDLKNKFGSIKPAFPDLSLEFIIALAKYVNEVTPQQYDLNESMYRPKFIADSSSVSSSDCGADTSYYSAIEEDFAEYDTTFPPAVLSDATIKLIDPGWEGNFLEYLEELDRQRYEFRVEANGWYNIDAFLKPGKSIKNVRLKVQVISTEKMALKTLVLVPSKRAMLESTNREGQLYKFVYNEDGTTLPLSVGYRALALTFGSVKDKIVYGVKEFVISNDQTIKIDLQETTKEKLQNLLLSKNIDGVSLEAIEKQQVIIPKPCDQ
ncbi:hypothetical protein LZZ85_19900 [Terrimonas sp. NA20]|uniref:Cytochrome c domain-containing protein n=1 Tax=Terrimonas ginsenosidimutans TaxID=2908004 RepID=A0ABS9KWB7_9BACT|nr:hypothetical protein [Terrimonas ginsenosidimutans]MCG2616573.1 hypothetical protein [Terrimonas ginsenosidimutans]